MIIVRSTSLILIPCNARIGSAYGARIPDRVGDDGGRALRAARRELRSPTTSSKKYVSSGSDSSGSI